jgi:hypothetical protein
MSPFLHHASARTRLPARRDSRRSHANWQTAGMGKPEAIQSLNGCAGFKAATLHLVPLSVHRYQERVSLSHHKKHPPRHAAPGRHACASFLLWLPKVRPSAGELRDCPGLSQAPTYAAKENAEFCQSSGMLRLNTKPVTPMQAKPSQSGLNGKSKKKMRACGSILLLWEPTNNPTCSNHN